MNNHYHMALSWWRNRGKKFSKHQGQHLNPSSSIPCSHLYHPSEYSDLPNLAPILHTGNMRLCPFTAYFNTSINTKIWAATEPWLLLHCCDSPLQSWVWCFAIWEIQSLYSLIHTFHTFNRTVKSGIISSLYRQNNETMGGKSDWLRSPRTAFSWFTFFSPGRSGLLGKLFWRA